VKSGARRVPIAGEDTTHDGSWKAERGTGRVEEGRGQKEVGGYQASFNLALKKCFQRLSQTCSERRLPHYSRAREPEPHLPGGLITAIIMPLQGMPVV
jgi:hypothetical protein